MPLRLELKGVSYSYPFSFEGERALESVDLCVNPGEILCVLGPNGAGKSTLAQVCAGALTPTSGSILLDGKPVETRKERLDLRRRASILFQCAEDQLFSEDVFTEVAFGLMRRGLKGLELESLVREACGLLDLDLELLARRSPFTLSNGEKRRVALASVLVVKPELMILDEPFIGLDSESRALLLKAISRYQEEYGAGVLLVTHEPSPVMGIADRFAFLSEGRLLRVAWRDELATETEMLEGYGFRPRQWAWISSFLSRKGMFLRNPFDPAEIASALLKVKGLSR